MSASCLLLFESGHSAEVKLNAYQAAADARRPVDAYMMSDCGPACTEAAIRAVEIVHQLAPKYGIQPSPTVYGFDLKGDRKGSRIAGASGGLAFVVAAAIHTLSLECGAVAATGVLSAADPDAPLLPVASIHAKLKAVLTRYPENSTVLYPRANDTEIDAPLRDRFAEQGIRLLAVSSAAEAIRLLAGETGRTETDFAGEYRKFFLFIFLAATLAGAVPTLYYLVKKHVVKTDIVKTDMVKTAEKKTIEPVTMAEPLKTGAVLVVNSRMQQEPQADNDSPVLSARNDPRIDTLPLPVKQQRQPPSSKPMTGGFD